MSVVRDAEGTSDQKLGGRQTDRKTPSCPRTDQTTGAMEEEEEDNASSMGSTETSHLRRKAGQR